MPAHQFCLMSARTRVAVAGVDQNNKAILEVETELAGDGEARQFYGIVSAVEAATGVAIAADGFGHSFGDRLKLSHLTSEPKPISAGIAGTKDRLSPGAEKFWQCAKEAASRK
jgi:hypothetical protein